MFELMDSFSQTAVIKVVGVGGLAPGEERRVDLSVEIFDPPPGI